MIKRYKRPDRKNAISLIESSRRDIKYTLTIEPTKESATTIIRNIYESFRMLGDALLIARGIESSDHLDSIQELMNLKISLPIHLGNLQNLRILRHNLNYYGYSPRVEEVLEVIEFAKGNFEILFCEISKIINSQ